MVLIPLEPHCRALMVLIPLEPHCRALMVLIPSESHCRALMVLIPSEPHCRALMVLILGTSLQGINGIDALRTSLQGINGIYVLRTSFQGINGINGGQTDKMCRIWLSCDKIYLLCRSRLKRSVCRYRSQAMTAWIPEKDWEKRTFTRYVPHNKRSINGYHRTSNRLVPARTEVQRMRNGQNILPT